MSVPRKDEHGLIICSGKHCDEGQYPAFLEAVIEFFGNLPP